MTISFDKADALARLMEEKDNNKEEVGSLHETLLHKYQNTTVSLHSPTLSTIELSRYVDILRHEYLTSIYDVKLWKIRTGDSYPTRRLEEMEKFLKEFDQSVKAYSVKG